MLIDIPSQEYWIPLLLVASSLLTGLVIFSLGEEQHALRGLLNMLGASVKLVLLGILFWGVAEGREYETRISIFLDLNLILRVDLLSLLFVSLSSVLWFVTTLYAIGYLEGSSNRSRFFGFFSMCVTASVGIALAGNLITFFIFYEFLTLTTYPLVVHRGTAKSLSAGRTYLWYTLSGGTVLFVGVVWMHTLAGPLDFGDRGVLELVATEHPLEIRLLFILLVLSLGVKAALVPLHGWLPVAMVAPAPVSALLHAVAVVKAGAFGIMRVVYDVYGPELVADIRLLTPLAVLASFTIVYGSIRALSQSELKKRLAYSTVSQLSYIALGVSLLSPTAMIGALVHLVHQGIMKITLFFCAGNLAETLGLHRIDQLSGVGRRMPLTMGAFTVAALGMIGAPPVAGFVSKWYLVLGALDAEQAWVIGILLASSLLNCAYFLPILRKAWFENPKEEWTTRRESRHLETSWTLLVPPLVTALFSLLNGLFALAIFSPLELAQEIMRSLFDF